jgi:predicted CoA-binding protein
MNESPSEHWRRGIMSRPTIAIVGASRSRSKFGNKAVRAYSALGFDVYPINPAADRVEGIKAYAHLADVPLEKLDRVSFYVPAEVGLMVLDEVARKQVGELWLNPGADEPDVVARAHALGINVVQACSLLAIGASTD